MGRCFAGLLSKKNAGALKNEIDLRDARTEFHRPAGFAPERVLRILSVHRLEVALVAEVGAKFAFRIVSGI
ncbi:MAG: hypothetical protein Q4E13_07585 [Clostridia bacterium]|nr:hypothetical protein [Clostridia bacterium]